MMKEPTGHKPERIKLLEKCKDHKFYPVKLEAPGGDKATHVLYTACPNCGAVRIRYAFFVDWSDGGDTG